MGNSKLGAMYQSVLYFVLYGTLYHITVLVTGFPRITHVCFNTARYGGAVVDCNWSTSSLAGTFQSPFQKACSEVAALSAIGFSWRYEARFQFAVRAPERELFCFAEGGGSFSVLKGKGLFSYREVPSELWLEACVHRLDGFPD